jgi:antitoxin (DNA-binding transcriptional repressor) of toxin-antitoxin stability system
MTRTTEVQEFVRRAVEWVKQVQSGDELLLTQNHQPVARLVPARADETALRDPLRLRSLRGHRVLTPVISQAELADELFDRP